MKNIQTLTERLQELAGIKEVSPFTRRKPQASGNEEDIVEISGEEMKDFLMQEGELNEGVFAAIGGLIALLGAAGVTTALEMALEDPAISEKYPKLTKVFDALKAIGNSGLTKGIK